MNRIASIRWTLLATAAVVTLGGCSLFHHRDDYYRHAKQTRPLEVPPDLDAPPISDELAVPEPEPDATPAPSASSVGSAPPEAVLSQGALHVADTVDHTWMRVGLALERAQVGTITGRDEAAHSYAVEVSGLRPAPAAEPHEKRHWYSRILHPFGGGRHQPQSGEGQPVSGKLSVVVSADGDGARVQVSGAPGTDSSEASRRLLEVLRSRLG